MNKLCLAYRGIAYVRAQQEKFRFLLLYLCTLISFFQPLHLSFLYSQYSYKQISAINYKIHMELIPYDTNIVKSTQNKIISELLHIFSRTLHSVTFRHYTICSNHSKIKERRKTARGRPQ